MATVNINRMLQETRDYTLIIFGLVLYAVGFTGFILPHGIVIGGLSGVGSLVYFATDKLIRVSVTQYACNLLLLAIAWRIVGKKFVARTIFGATVLSLAIGIFESFFSSIGHPLIAEMSMSAILGGILCGIGIGIVFIHNGSSGGTDIVAAMVAKVSNVTIGRTMIYCDMLIVLTSVFLPFDGTLEERLNVRVPMIVYGWVVTFVIAYMCDMIINTNRQATQFIIFSSKWEEIANLINKEAHRGVTVIDGTGWYSKNPVKLLLVCCRKIESVHIFRIVKGIDEHAFITQTNVNGVYGEGFDKMIVKIKKPKRQIEN
ncbi:MAG: YitT family protein [Muribaculaceae bacterium]|nr:YitT family protein [Muribaculaceae bacterium]